MAYLIVALLAAASVASAAPYAAPWHGVAIRASGGVSQCNYTYCDLGEGQPGDMFNNTYCARCETATKCTQCEAGYALEKSTNACLKCDPNCADAKCSDPLACSKCKSGYVLAETWSWTEGELVIQDEADCPLKRQYCFSCEDGNCAKGACKNVNSTFRGGCTACPEGSVPVRPIEREPGDNPFMCSIPGGEGCEGCNETCVNPNSPYCYACPTGSGFVYENDTAPRNRCEPCADEHCWRCQDNALDQCTQCDTETKLVNGTCKPLDYNCPANCKECVQDGADPDRWDCTFCADGYYRDIDNGTCKSMSECPVEHCAECEHYTGLSETDYCVQCKDGYERVCDLAGCGAYTCVPVSTS